MASSLAGQGATCSTVFHHAHRLSATLCKKMHLQLRFPLNGKHVHKILTWFFNAFPLNVEMSPSKRWMFHCQQSFLPPFAQRSKLVKLQVFWWMAAHHRSCFPFGKGQVEFVSIFCDFWMISPFICRRRTEPLAILSMQKKNGTHE